MAAVNATSYLSRTEAQPSTTLIADNTAQFGVPGRVRNIAGLVQHSVQAVAIGTSTTPTLTADQFVSGVWDVSGSPGGGVTLTTPTAAQIFASLPSTIPQDGSYNIFVECLNDATGQTLTVTGGSGVTVLGTATVANNYCREYVVNINVSAGTVTMINKGVKPL